MNKRPLITILIASFNRLQFLKQSLESALVQKFDDYEILVVDDGSEDETKAYLRSLKEIHKNVRIIFQNNSGVASARQKGLENSEGKYICILDSDDLLIDTALTIISSYIDKFPDVDLFYCNNLEIHPDGHSKASSYRQFSSNKKFIRAICSFPRIPFKHSGTTFKLDKALEINGYDKNLAMKIDIDFILSFLGNDFECFFIQKPLVHYYFHPNSISRKSRIKGLSIWYVIIDRHIESLTYNLLFKISRTIFELMKLIYERINLHK